MRIRPKKELYRKIIEDKFQADIKDFGLRTEDLTTGLFLELLRKEFVADAAVRSVAGHIWVATMGEGNRLTFLTMTRFKPDAKKGDLFWDTNAPLREVELGLGPIDPGSEEPPNRLRPEGMKIQRDGKSGFKVDYFDIDGVEIFGDMEFANPKGMRKPGDDTVYSRNPAGWFPSPSELFEGFKERGENGSFEAKVLAYNILRAVQFMFLVKKDVLGATLGAVDAVRDAIVKAAGTHVMANLAVRGS